MYTAPELSEEEPKSEAPAGEEIYDHSRHAPSDLRIQNTGLHRCDGQLYGRILLGMPQDQGVGLLYTRELRYGDWFITRYELDGMRDSLMELDLGWTCDSIAAVDVHIKALRKALKLVVPPPTALDPGDDEGPSDISESPRSPSIPEPSGPDEAGLDALQEQEVDHSRAADCNPPSFYDPSEDGSGGTFG
jgi:hypothetical protein